MSYYLYVETAFHHEGDKKYLIKLIDEAKKSGAKGIKFQVLIELDEFMSSKHTAYSDAKGWTLSYSDWKEIFNYTKNIDLDIILMPLDVKAFDLVNEFDIKYIEIHSVSFKDELLLSKLDESNIPLIFGVGGRTVSEIDSVINKYSDNREIVLMVGFQSFPSSIEDIKLERIKELKNKYQNCVIGYADHSGYSDDMAIKSNEYAYILGARVFEKHISLEEGKERIDFQSAVSFSKIKIIDNNLKNLERIFSYSNEEIFKLSEKEKNYRDRQKIPVANKDLIKDEILTKDMISLKMINNENSIESIDLLIGKKLTVDKQKDESFLSKDFN